MLFLKYLFIAIIFYTSDKGRDALQVIQQISYHRVLKEVPSGDIYRDFKQIKGRYLIPPDYSKPPQSADQLPKSVDFGR
jgi:hypothetical protein